MKVRDLFRHEGCPNFNNRPWIVLSTWLYAVKMSFKTSQRAMVLGLKLLSDVLLVKEVPPNRLQLYGSVCAHIGNQSIMDFPPEPSDWVYIADNVFTLAEFSAAYIDVVYLLEGKLYPPTVLSIAQEVNAEGITVYADIATLAVIANYTCLCLDPYILMKACYYLQQNLENSVAPKDWLQHRVHVSINHLLTVDRKWFEKYFESAFDLFTSVKPAVTTLVRPPSQLPQTKAEKSYRPYEEFYPLGSGTFGQVVLARRDQEIIAIKTQGIEEETAPIVELSVLATYKHENVIRMVDFYLTDKVLEIDLESGQSFYDVLYPTIGRKELWYETFIEGVVTAPLIPLERRRRYQRQICRGVEYLHSMGIIHRDLKPENLLLVGDTIKIADFGLAYQMCLSYNDTSRKSTEVGTVFYRPPEILVIDENAGNEELASQYAFDLDVWAVGCILLEIEAGLTPFYAPLEDVLPDAAKKEYPAMVKPPGVEYVIGDYDLKVLWAIWKILGSPFGSELYRGYPFARTVGTDLISVKDDTLRLVILSMLQYEPKKRIHMNDVDF